MENKNDDIIKTLNNLIEVNYDRAKGYQTAADGTEDSDLKSLFNKYSSQSLSFKTELDSLVRARGGKPQESSSASGAVYRAWMNTKAALTGKDRKGVLSSCEFGEDVAKKTYADTKEDAMSYPADVLSVINRQYEEILKAHDHIKNMRDTVEEHHHH
jgi:uncharacterized protein (TIGR02284 family)